MEDHVRKIEHDNKGVITCSKNRTTYDPDNMMFEKSNAKKRGFSAGFERGEVYKGGGFARGRSLAQGPWFLNDRMGCVLTSVFFGHEHSSDPSRDRSLYAIFGLGA